uniref:Vps72/YL1 C-terminal domain-containing protein n=1 Tax=Neovison vison TaxID=452646 RepID=A0A8C7BZT5_NEOVI
MSAHLPLNLQPRIAQNSKKRLASHSHKGRSSGGYSARKKKVSTTSFRQGLLANYTDPQSKLEFSTTEEFSCTQRLPFNVTTDYVSLRKATSITP